MPFRIHGEGYGNMPDKIKIGRRSDSKKSLDKGGV